MKGKYITFQILLACLSKPVIKKDIHAQIEETLCERKKIMQQFEDFSRKARMIDMYRDMKEAA